MNRTLKAAISKVGWCACILCPHLNTGTSCTRAKHLVLIRPYTCVPVKVAPHIYFLIRAPTVHLCPLLEATFLI